MKDKAKLIFSRRTLSNLFLILTGILFFLALSNFNLVLQRVNGIISILNPFIIGFVIAYLLNLPMRFFETRVYQSLKFRRGLSILTVYLLAAAILAALLGLVLPQVAQSVMTLVMNLPVYLENLNRLMAEFTTLFHLEQKNADTLLVTYTDLIQQLTEAVKTALPQILDFSLAIGNGLISMITALISSIYMLASKHTLNRQMKKLLFCLVPPQTGRRIISITSQANQVFAGFINGKIIDSAIIGVLCYLGMLLIGLPYAVLISTIIAVTNIIPFFGPFIGAIPSVMILLIVDPWGALWFLIFVILLQQFDGNILGPKILGDSTGLSAIWVLISIVVGGGLFGFPGMVLGVPTCAVLYNLTSEWVNRRLREKAIDNDGNRVTCSKDALSQGSAVENPLGDSERL